MIRATLAQVSPKLSKDNITLHEDIIKEQIGKSDIVVFPELSLNGYLLMDRVYDDAYIVEELEVFKTLSS
ncbi:MAG TPA: nitrilase, partial [Campylobacterales bacterium]|nr:nitrilase [Campylobacterales bacterium]